MWIKLLWFDSWVVKATLIMIDHEILLYLCEVIWHWLNTWQLTQGRCHDWTALWWIQFDFFMIQSVNYHRHYRLSSVRSDYMSIYKKSLIGHYIVASPILFYQILWNWSGSIIKLPRKNRVIAVLMQDLYSQCRHDYNSILDCRVIINYFRQLKKQLLEIVTLHYINMWPNPLCWRVFEQWLPTEWLHQGKIGLKLSPSITVERMYLLHKYFVGTRNMS